VDELEKARTDLSVEITRLKNVDKTASSLKVTVSRKDDLIKVLRESVQKV
jgi:hypothetical protein